MIVDTLAAALLFAALGCALAVTPWRWALGALVCAAVATLAVMRLPVDQTWRDGLFLASWIAVAVIAATVHLPSGLGKGVALVTALLAGGMAGALLAASGQPDSRVLLGALTWPAAAGLARVGYRIAVKVAASWLLAVAILSTGVALVPTPGFKPDHME